MTTPARVLFVCWIAVALSGTVVVHRHAVAAGHTHGLGWAALHGTNQPCNCPVEEPHRHFILFGIEFGAVPACADGSTTDGIRCMIGESCQSGDTAFDTIDSTLVAAISDEPLMCSLPTATRRISHSPRFDSPVRSHARSGVLRS